MTEPKRLDFERPPTSAELAKKAAEQKGTPKSVIRRGAIPKLPPLEVDPSDVRKADQRSVACLSLRNAGAPWHEIAKLLDYADAGSAKAAYIAALANSAPVEDFETLRQMEAMRAESLFRRSLAMASADYLVVHRTATDDEGNDYEIEEHVPNTDKLRWHEQAGKDLALHAMITGAKAPARVEVTADTQELNQMVQVLLQRGQLESAREADIFDAEIIPDEPEGMGE